MKIFEDITKTIGNTPLVRMKHLGKDIPADILLKLEFFNPLSSVKDRIGLAMIEAAEKSGKLQKGSKILEPTSGNTGVSLAFICASRGYHLTLVMPETMSQERRTLLLMLGAEVRLTPAANGMKGAIAKALEIFDQDKTYFMPSQFDNPANPEIHRKTTALEIWNDTDGKVDVVICGVGTGGTLSGIGEVLKSKKASVQMIAVEPVESAVISGEKPGPHKIQGIGAGFIPKNLDKKYVDGVETVSSEQAMAMARMIIKQEGIPVGISGGAAMVAALRRAALPENKGKMIVVMLASATERYLSTLLAEQDREKAKNLPVEAPLEIYLAKAGI